MYFILNTWNGVLFVSFPTKLERINRAREQGWRNVLSAGGSGEMKVGLGYLYMYTAAL